MSAGASGRERRRDEMKGAFTLKDGSIVECEPTGDETAIGFTNVIAELVAAGILTMSIAEVAVVKAGQYTQKEMLTRLGIDWDDVVSAVPIVE
jgi:hypothetical protein